MKRDGSMICFLDPSMFAETERGLLESPSYSVSAFRYRSGVEALRIRAGRGEFVWLPYLGQQVWDWRVDGKSVKFEGFVKEPSYGRNFLENYGAFLLHCGMTAMGNPGPNDKHLPHGELPVARFDEAWIEMGHGEGGEELSLCGRIHWHVPFVAEYVCAPSLRVSPDGLSLHAELRLDNPGASALDYMYLAHINFAFSGAERILSTIPFAPERVAIRNEIFPGLAANPESIKRIDQAADYAPELVAILDHGGMAGGSAGSILVRGDGSCRWVRQEGPELDHHVIWITHAAGRGACGFHLPSTAGPDGLERERARGNMKHLAPGGGVTLRYACGFCDKLEAAPVERAE